MMITQNTARASYVIPVCVSVALTYVGVPQSAYACVPCVYADNMYMYVYGRQLVVRSFGSEEQAIAEANSTPYLPPPPP